MTTGPTDVMNVERGEYDWTSATKDIALMTRLTLREASALTSELGVTDLVPYDVVMRLVDLVNATAGGRIGEALRVLLTGDDRPLWQVFTERRARAEGSN